MWAHIERYWKETVLPKKKKTRTKRTPLIMKKQLSSQNDRNELPKTHQSSPPECGSDFVWMNIGTTSEGLSTRRQSLSFDTDRVKWESKQRVRLVDLLFSRVEYHCFPGRCWSVSIRFIRISPRPVITCHSMHTCVLCHGPCTHMYRYLSFRKLSSVGLVLESA